MSPDLSMLKGLALQEDSSKAVKLFSVKQLPKQAAARFKALFQERTQWSWQDLQPYVDDLQTSQPLQLHNTKRTRFSAHAVRPSYSWNTVFKVHTKRAQRAWQAPQPYVDNLRARHVSRAVA